MALSRKNIFLVSLVSIVSIAIGAFFIKFGDPEYAAVYAMFYYISGRLMGISEV